MGAVPSAIQNYANAWEAQQLATATYLRAKEQMDFAVLTTQDTWRTVKTTNTKRGIHLVRGNRAVLVANGDYPEVFTLIPSDTPLA